MSSSRLIALAIAIVVVGSTSVVLGYEIGLSVGSQKGYEQGYLVGTSTTLVAVNTQTDLAPGAVIVFSPPLFKTYNHLNLSYSFTVISTVYHNNISSSNNGTVDLIVSDNGKVLFQTGNVSSGSGYATVSDTELGQVSVLLKANTSNSGTIVIGWRHSMQMFLN